MKLPNLRLLSARTWMMVGLAAVVCQTAPAVIDPSDWGQKNRVWTYIGPGQGSTKDEALHAARARAVQAATGRFCFGEEMFVAQNLLEKYLAQYAEKFVAATQTLEHRQVGATHHVVARVNVWVDQLYTDLLNKRFTYLPKTNPVFAVFLRETIDGGEVKQPFILNNLRNIVKERGLSLYEGELPAPPAATDLTADPQAMETALREAQKYGVEVLIAGAIQTTKVSTEKLYYSDLTFYESTVRLSLIRVVTGEVLDTAEVTRRVARRNGAEAIKVVAPLVAEKAIAEVIEAFTSSWAKTVHDSADYRIMLTDVTPDVVRAFSESLKRLDPSVRVYARCAFGRVTVLNIDFAGDRKLLVTFLSNLSHPQFRIAQAEDSRFELEVIHQHR